VAGVHVGEVQAEARVPLDIGRADVEEAELQVTEAAGDGRRRSAPGAVGVAVGEGQSTGRGVDLPKPGRVAMAVVDDGIDAAGGAVGVADLDDPPGIGPSPSSAI
jgi:hypothetical protein